MRDQLEILVKQMIDHGILFGDAVSEFEKRFIKRVLDENKGNHSKTAKALGIHRNTLRRKVEELELDHRPKRRSRKPRQAGVRA